MAAATELTFAGIDQDSELYTTLQGGSLLAEQALQDTPPSPQELVAAAQADYGRLLAVLYDNGYFGPVVKITLDGVDASAIPPVSPPRSVNRAMIEIDTGPKFTLSTAKIGPVAPETELPEGGAIRGTPKQSC
jgi:translocation and assembly module TamA